MDVFFLRHAIAVQRGTSEYPNDDRPLTKDGIRKMKKAARGIAALVDSFDVMLSSPLVRAYDTARIAADAVGYTSDIEQCTELLPGAGIADFLALVEHHRDAKKILVVGHEPNLSSLVSALLGSQRTVIEFKKGALCLVNFAGRPALKKGTLAYLVTSKQLRAMAD